MGGRETGAFFGERGVDAKELVVELGGYCLSEEGFAVCSDVDLEYRRS